MKLKNIIIFFILIVIAHTSCVKSRECVCYENVSYGTDTMPDRIYINGNKKDAKNACINLADSNEVCNLK